MKNAIWQQNVSHSSNAKNNKIKTSQKETMEENQKNKRKKTTGQKKNRVKAKKCQRHLSK